MRWRSNVRLWRQGVKGTCAMFHWCNWSALKKSGKHSRVPRLSRFLTADQQRGQGK
jgi:hypothetical protein